MKTKSVQITLKFLFPPRPTLVENKIRTLFFQAIFGTLGLDPLTFLIVYLVALVVRIPNWYETCL